MPVMRKKTTKVTEIFSVEGQSECLRPLYTVRVSAGFPSPAEDYLEGQLDLNKYLIEHPAATYFVRVAGDSMVNAGIHSGDLLIVDRALEPRDKSIVIANINGELTVKRIRLRRGKILLVPENDDYPTQSIEGDMDFNIWGVVRHVIHSV